MLLKNRLRQESNTFSLNGMFPCFLSMLPD